MSSCKSLSSTSSILHRPSPPPLAGHESSGSSVDDMMVNNISVDTMVASDLIHHGGISSYLSCTIHPMVESQLDNNSISGHHRCFVRRMRRKSSQSPSDNELLVDIGNSSSRRCSTTVARSTLGWIVFCLCITHHYCLPSLVDAFGNTPYSSQRLSSRSSTSFGHHPYKQYRSTMPILPADIAAIRSAWGRRRVVSQQNSMLVSRSTINDETLEMKIEVPKTLHMKEINRSSLNGSGDVNGVNGHINGGVNGHVNGDTNGVETNSASHQLQQPNRVIPINDSNQQQSDSEEAQEDGGTDVPHPTAAGGYTHTSSSKAKISAANKGKTPWNKGKTRSDEVKARIAEGVRRRNRERFLAKLEEEGITEEEYNQKKKEERRKKDAERRARRTEKGGYTPTNETKQKISNILKEKYASGEIVRTRRSPSTVRRGFKHSEETKQKIRESLKKKWAEDEEYRELMTNKTVANNAIGNSPSVRKRIAETLKKKWEEPEFRAKMMEKFAHRKQRSASKATEHRKKISEAMKKKWMDEEYRKRATDGMAKGRESAPPRMVKPVRPKMPKMVTPLVATTQLTKSKEATTKTKAKRKKKASAKKSSKSSGDASITAVEPISLSPPKTAPKKVAKIEEPEPDGSINRLREERRDLYDLLYGDEDEDNVDGASFEGNSAMSPPLPNMNVNRGMVGRRLNGEDNPSPRSEGKSVTGEFSSSSIASLLGDDDDLDEFDPYGLDNF